MFEVEVLYADLSRVSVPIDEADTLSTAAVLAIVVRDTTIEGKKQNIVIAQGSDNYALCQRKMNGGPWVEIYKWDDDDFIWHRLNNHLSVEARYPVDPPLGCMHIVFRGEYVDADVWEEAVRILDKEIL